MPRVSSFALCQLTAVGTPTIALSCLNHKHLPIMHVNSALSPTCPDVGIFSRPRRHSLSRPGNGAPIEEQAAEEGVVVQGSTLPGEQALWLLREALGALCVQDSTSVPRDSVTDQPDDTEDTSDDDATETQLSKLHAGDHVQVRLSEKAGFTEHAVVVALRVDGAQRHNHNKMIAYTSGAGGDVGEGFISVQCAGADMTHMGPRSIEWRYVAREVVALLREKEDVLASDASGDAAAGGGGGAAAAAIKSPASESGEFIWRRAALFRHVAPFVLEHKDVISISDFEWFVGELARCASPPQHVLAKLQAHVDALKTASDALCVRFACLLLVESSCAML